MNDTLQNTVNQVLQGAISQATKGAEFLREQIPDILQQLLMWNLAKDGLLVALAMLSVFIAYKATFKWADQSRSSYDNEWKLPKIASAIFGIIASGITTVFAVIALFDAVKILVAPKVWLLEYAAELVRYAR